MNRSVTAFIRKELKAGLAQVSENSQLLFKRMYANGELEKHINDVVDDMPEEKLDWALTQVERTIEQNKKEGV